MGIWCGLIQRPNTRYSLTGQEDSLAQDWRGGESRERRGHALGGVEYREESSRYTTHSHQLELYSLSVVSLCTPHLLKKFL